MIKKIFWLIFLMSKIITAQWLPTGTPICDTSANSTQFLSPQICSDDKDGAFICWMDVRSGGLDIYAQHINKDGKNLWQKNGIQIVNDSAKQQYPKIVNDGVGGAYIAWEDDRDGNTFIYAQRINANGELMWKPNGVKVAEKGGLFISLDRDVKNGLLVGWNYLNGDLMDDVCVQRLNNSGNRVWADSGIQVSNRTGTVFSGDVIVRNDEHGGLYVCWSEGEDNLMPQIYIQRVDSLGQIVFQSNGISLTNNGKQNSSLNIGNAQFGSLIINWGTSPPPGSLDSSRGYIQRVSIDGQLLWGQNGIMLRDVGGNGSTRRRNSSDGHGGAFIGYKNFIQHVDSIGNFLWGEDGVTFTTIKTGFNETVQVLNAESGIWTIWTQYPGGPQKIYAQYIDKNGMPLWGINGKRVSADSGFQQYSNAVPSNNGNAIIVWEGFRNDNGIYSGVYVSKLDTSGIVTTTKKDDEEIPESFRLEQNFPNPFNPSTIIKYYLPKNSFVSLKIFDLLGREITTLVNEKQFYGEQTIKFSAESISSGIYFYRLTAGTSSITKKMVIIH